MSLVNISILDTVTAEDMPGNKADAFAGLCRPVVGVEKAREPGELVRLAMAGNDIHFTTGGKWSLHDLFLSALETLGPSELAISTYSITEFPARILAKALEDGKLTALRALLDVRAKAQSQAVMQLVGSVATQLRLASVHAKAMVLDNGSDLFCVIGSANWTTNPRLETGVITTSKDAGNFHRNWILKALDNGHKFDN